jgi:hypothetical protein
LLRVFAHGRSWVVADEINHFWVSEVRLRSFDIAARVARFTNECAIRSDDHQLFDPAVCMDDGGGGKEGEKDPGGGPQRWHSGGLVS